MQPRISMITLGVKDIKKSIEFYQNGLGFKRFEPYDDNVAFFELNGTWLGLFGKEALAKDANVEYNESSFNGFSLAHNLTSKQQVDTVFAEALKAGAIETKKPQEVFWGGYSGYFKDPDGYLWEIAYNPFMWIGPKD